jgi:hypothetical protein
MKGPLSTEVRQSLQLLVVSALVLGVYVGLGVLALHVLA